MEVLKAVLLGLSIGFILTAAAFNLGYSLAEEFDFTYSNSKWHYNYQQFVNKHSTYNITKLLLWSVFIIGTLFIGLYMLIKWSFKKVEK